MPLQDRMDRLGAVAAHLPFSLEDYDAVNRTFCRWTERRDDADLETLEIWLYCYAQRFVYVRMPYAEAGEADRIIGDVFARVRTQFDRVEDPARFSHFTAVVCRNTFRNGLRRRRHSVDLDAEAIPADDPEPPLDEPDRSLIHHTLDRAIATLPERVGVVARMRLLEGRSYRAIASATGHPLPTIRTYVSKALARLREDPGVRTLAALFDYAPP